MVSYDHTNVQFLITRKNNYVETSRKIRRKNICPWTYYLVNMVWGGIHPTTNLEFTNIPIKLRDIILNLIKNHAYWRHRVSWHERIVTLIPKKKYISIPLQWKVTPRKNVTHSQTYVADTRLNRPRGRFSETVNLKKKSFWKCCKT